jgi:integrase
VTLAVQTQKMRRALLERFRAEDGEKRIAKMQREHVAKRIASKKAFAARNWLKTLRGLMQFAVTAGLRDDDPTAGINLPHARAGTIHTWTEAEIAIFEARHEIGSRPRLAMALLLYTAARRGDAVGLGPQHIRNGMLAYRQQKTGRILEIPVHPELSRIIASSPRGHLTFLTAAAGAPFSAAGFGNRFRQWCNEASLSHCSAHGLRKAQARRLAEAGCSAHEIAAITGHKTLAEVQRYADAASQSRMARSAMATVTTAFPVAETGTSSGKPRE